MQPYRIVRFEPGVFIEFGFDRRATWQGLGINRPGRTTAVGRVGHERAETREAEPLRVGVASGPSPGASRGGHQ